MHMYVMWDSSCTCNKAVIASVSLSQPSSTFKSKTSTGVNVRTTLRTVNKQTVNILTYMFSAIEGAWFSSQLRQARHESRRETQALYHGIDVARVSHIV